MGDLDTAISNDIMKEKTSRYRRNVLAVAVVLVALNLLRSSIDFSNFGFLGVRLVDQNPSNETYVYWLLWTAVAYNLANFLVYVFGDFQVWMERACEPHPGREHPNRCPQWYMYLGFPPTRIPPFIGRTINHKSKNQPVDLSKLSWKMGLGEGIITWETNVPSPKDGQPTIVKLCTVRESQFIAARRQLKVFFCLELGLPALVLVAAIVSRWVP